jgi:hypothetical protein
MPRSTKTAHPDRHRQLRSAYSNNDHENDVPTGHYAHSGHGAHVFETEVLDLTYDLVLTSFQIEALEEELDDAGTEITMLREENVMLREDDRSLKDCLNAQDKFEHQMIVELTSRLEHLHEHVQDLNDTLQVVLDDVCAAEGDEPSGYYFEGAWEDMARLWREGPIERNTNHGRNNRAYGGCEHRDATIQDSYPEDVLQQQGTECVHESMTETDPFGLSRHFERSSAPSPEERRPHQTSPDMLRQIETEMAIIHLQDRLERMEAGMGDLTRRCDVQDQSRDLLVEMFDKHGKAFSDLLGIIHAVQEEDEDDDDEPYCTCDEYEDLGSPNRNAVLRGGMGGRDEDEEFVYDYGGYTNWDQMDASSQCEGVETGQTSDGDKVVIQELRQQIAHLEEQVRTLTAAMNESRLPLPKDTQEREEGDLHLRGGSRQDEVEVDGSCDVCTNTSALAASVPSSPHLLCQRAISRFSELAINYMIVYLPPGFVIPGSNSPELVFHNAATIYYFPTGATEDIVKQEAWMQKGCGRGRWQDVVLHKIQSKQVFKSAIANMWRTMGLNWEVLTRGEWNFDEDRGDMYMVNDNNLFLTNRTREVAGPHIRGGSGDEPDPSVHAPIQIPHQANSDEVKSISEWLTQEAATPCSDCASSHCGHSWMTLASVLYTRNCFLERELDNFKEINQSLAEDLNWQMDAQVEMEERLEAAVAEKNAIAEDFRVLRTRLRHVIEATTSHIVQGDDKEEQTLIGEDRTGSPDSGMMQGGDADVASSATSSKDKALQAAPCSPPGICTTIKAKSFDFYPKMSTIVFAGTSPYLYQFPYRSTLPEIRSILKSRDGEEVLSDDPYIARVLEIMKIREHMGIELPENISEQRVAISIPDVSDDSHLDRGIKIATWQVYDEDAKSLEKLVTKLVIDPDAAESSTTISDNTTSSEGEGDYYQDVGDLVNLLNNTVGNKHKTIPQKFCMCQTHLVNDSESLSGIIGPRPSHVVSVRGGGNDSAYWNHDANADRRFPLHYPKWLVQPGSPLNTPACYGTMAPNMSRIPENEEIATSRGSLSMRLGRLMFSAKFVQMHEKSISRFNWKHVKHLNPQIKDKSSRGFRYTESAHCEGWAMRLDEHREHCDYCQAVFIEEDYDMKHLNFGRENDAPMSKGGDRNSWKKNVRQINSNASGFSAVQDQDWHLRGGAGHEKDLEHGAADSEDWRSEWDDLASQTQCSGCQSRVFRNSSTLSTKTTFSPPSPVDRSFRTRRWPHPLDICTADEFLRSEPWSPDIEHMRLNRRQVRAGQLSNPPYNTRHKSPDILTPSRTSNPFLLEIRRLRYETHLADPPSNCETVSTKDSDSVLELRAETWLENPRPAPPLPFQRNSVSVLQDTAELHDASPITTLVSASATKVNSVPRELSFRSDRHKFFPRSQCSTISESTITTTSQTRRSKIPLSEMLRDEAYKEHLVSIPGNERKLPSPRPKLGERLCKRCAELLALLFKYITKLRKRMIFKKSKKSVARSTFQTPAPPAPSRMGWEAWYMNRRLPSLPFDKSLPPIPSASMSTLILAFEPKEKFPAPPRASFSRLECARIVAQAQDSAHADFVSQEGEQWHVPTIAGPSDLVKEALMWLDYEAKSGQIGKAVFDGHLAEESEHERSHDVELESL